MDQVKGIAEPEVQAPARPKGKMRHVCVVCMKKKAVLQLSEIEWICDDCAQYMSDLAPRDYSTGK